MAYAQIMIVEDDLITAIDIQHRLENLGYDVPVIVSSGEEAIQKAEDIHPDLILMDILLEGDIDGVTAAKQIRARFNIPVIYLTAYSDENILQQAKITEPYGYILKPFNERSLQTTIEMALYKHEMERKLRESEQWLAATLKSIGDAVIATDVNGLITFMNPVAELLTGWKQKDALGKEVKKIFNIIDEETRTTINNPVEEMLEDCVTIDIANNHTILIAKDGTEIYFDNNVAPIRDERGNTTGVVLVFRDITKRKRLEQQLLQSQKMASLGIMAGGVAHEINNPLNVISGVAQLLEKRYLDEFAQKSIKIIRDAVSRASRIVNNLLDFAHREIHTSFELLSVNRIVEDTLSMLENRLNLQQIKILKNLADDLPLILGNVNQLQQVIMNLMLNAQVAMPKGGELSLETTHHNNQVVIKCSDTGEGISADDLEKIFDPFYTTRAPGEGTGLGLSVSYQIIKRHNGVIEAYSAGKNNGSTFTIRLPIYKRNATKE
jgi:PAS domain S-box-containing protein